MRCARVLLVVFLLAVLGVLYVRQHSLSLKLTQRLDELERTIVLAEEELDSIEIDIARLTGFCRLDSFYAAAMRLPAGASSPAVARAEMAGGESMQPTPQPGNRRGSEIAAAGAGN